MTPFDLAKTPLRQLNQLLHHELTAPRVEILNPAGMHNVAVGLDADVEVHVRGPRCRG